MSKYEEALKNLSCDVSKLCKEMGWEMDNKDIEIMKELIQVKSDLEAKLAESEKQANDWKQRFESSEERFKTFNSNGVIALNLKNEKIKKLKQQLAEKEKKQERTNKVVKQFQQRLKYWQEQDQDKISFAVEKLEKVKDFINNTDIKKLTGYLDSNSAQTQAISITNYIDNQIKQLKEGK